jgi:GntR family transcriptional regulator of arabinose operon
MTKHQRLFETLQHQILEGRYANNRRLPSESELALRYRVSRPTAARALKDLEAMGIIVRRAGSGSYLKPTMKPHLEIKGRILGLLVPGLGKTEILDPICNEITRFAQSMHCSVLWGDAQHPVESGEHALELCEKYIERGVDGVFFSPMELVRDRALWNRRVADRLTSAGIPLVLLDRDLQEFPTRSAYDLIGIDNLRAAMLVTQHLIEQGARRICFLAKPGYPDTTDLRTAGCREGVRRAPGVRYAEAFVDPTDVTAISSLLASRKPDAILCANDQTAALLLRTLYGLGVTIPTQISVAGFDDIQYATLLSVPLTTIRQPCREIGRAATLALLERISEPGIPPREILLPFELIVRQSTGGIPPADTTANRS